MEEQNKEKYEFTYSAPTDNERRVIQSIRNEYEPKTEAQNKLEWLKRLDLKVKVPPKVAAISLGVTGILIFGLGMSLALSFSLIILGVIISCVGVACMISAHPVKKMLLKINKKRYGEQILRLSEELLEK